jgi:hypothetical protein
MNDFMVNENSLTLLTSRPSGQSFLFGVNLALASHCHIIITNLHRRVEFTVTQTHFVNYC